MIVETPVSFADSISQTLHLANALAAPTEAEAQFEKRKPVIASFRGAIKRVLEYAKHETIRKLDRHLAKGSTESRPTTAITNVAGAADDRSLRLAFDLEEFIRDFFAALSAEQRVALQTAGQQLFDEIGRSDPWKTPAQATIDFIRTRENLMADIPTEIHQEIMDQIAEGLDAGESIRDLSQRITDTFGAIEEGRAETIASTETAAAYGFSRNEAMAAADIKYKKWVTSHLPTVRIAHAMAEGQIVPFDQPFIVGGEALMYPADENGSPANTINCHCISAAISDEEGAAAAQKT